MCVSGTYVRFVNRISALLSFTSITARPNETYVHLKGGLANWGTPHGHSQGRTHCLAAALRQTAVFKADCHQDSVDAYIFFLKFASASPERPDLLWGHPAPFSTGTVGSFPGDRVTGAWNWPLTSHCGVKSEWSGTSIPFLYYYGTHGDNFTFVFHFNHLKQGGHVNKIDTKYLSSVLTAVWKCFIFFRCVVMLEYGRSLRGQVQIRS
jgi:hypothetical protein